MSYEVLLGLVGVETLNSGGWYRDCRRATMARAGRCCPRRPRRGWCRPATRRVSRCVRVAGEGGEQPTLRPPQLHRPVLARRRQPAAGGRPRPAHRRGPARPGWRGPRRRRATAGPSGPTNWRPSIALIGLRGQPSSPGRCGRRGWRGPVRRGARAAPCGRTTLRPTVCPSGDQAMLQMVSVCPSSAAIWRSRGVPETHDPDPCPPAASQRPSGDQATTSTAPAGPRRGAMVAPAASQSQMSPSMAAAARRCPSRATRARCVTGLERLVSVRRDPPSAPRQPHHAVVSARGQGLAVRRPGQRPDRGGMAGERGPRLALRSPQEHRPLLRARRHRPAIGPPPRHLPQRRGHGGRGVATVLAEAAGGAAVGKAVGGAVGGAATGSAWPSAHRCVARASAAWSRPVGVADVFAGMVVARRRTARACVDRSRPAPVPTLRCPALAPAPRG